MRTFKQNAGLENPVGAIDLYGTGAGFHFDRLWTALGLADLGNDDAAAGVLDGEFDWFANQFANADRFSPPASERPALDPVNSVSDDDQDNSSTST
jgi:hypothetical protein